MAPTFFSKTGIAQRGIQGELTGHLSVTFVLTLFTFCNKEPNHHEADASRAVKHTCPPGPELLENVSSTSCLGIFVCGPLNLASQVDASVLSSSVTSSVSGGGFGKAGDGGGAVNMNRGIGNTNLFKGLWDTLIAKAFRITVNLQQLVLVSVRDARSVRPKLSNKGPS
jgi:hypothetical protein